MPNRRSTRVCVARPACLVVHHANAVHLNAQTVEKFSTTQVRSFDRQCSETCQELRRRFPSYYANESHHSRHCWRVNVTNGRLGKDESDARLVVDVKGRVRASVRVLHEQADLESGVPHHAAAQWLGVTSLRSTERTRTEALTAAVRALCDRHPALRVVINHNDAGTPADLRRPAKGSETDERIQTTYMPSTLLLWRRVLSPRNLATRNVKVLWFFSKDAVVHPSVRAKSRVVATNCRRAPTPTILALPLRRSFHWRSWLTCCLLRALRSFNPDRVASGTNTPAWQHTLGSRACTRRSYEWRRGLSSTNAFSRLRGAAPRPSTA